MKFSHVYLSILFCLLMLSFVSTGCGADDPSDAEGMVRLQGTWNLTSSSDLGCRDSGNNQFEEGLCQVQHCSQWQFQQLGVLLAIDLFEGGADTVRGSYTVDGRILNVTLNGETETGEFAVDARFLTHVVLDEDIDCYVANNFERVN